MRSARVRFGLRGMAAAQQFSDPTRRGNSGTLALFARSTPREETMKRALIVCSVLALAGCAAEPTREQSLVNRAAEAVGGDRWAAVRTVAVKGTLRQWEPEQSDVPGGEMRFANEANVDIAFDRAKRVSRTDWEKKFAYPSPRTFKFS